MGILENSLGTFTIKERELFFIIFQVGYSSPAEKGIIQDLGLSVAAVSDYFNELIFLLWLFFVYFLKFVLIFFQLSIVQYSVFGSILTIGGMIGAILSGRIADLVGRRGVSLPNNFFLMCSF